MRFKLLPVLCLLICMAAARAATGIVPASFKDDCLPLIKDRADLLSIAAAFDIQDAGRCLTGGVPDGAKFAPFVFPARPKGSTGAYNLLFVVQNGRDLAMAAGGFKDEYFASAMGIAILPRDIAPGNPILDFSKP